MNVQYIIISYYDDWGICRKRFEDVNVVNEKLKKKAYDRARYIQKKKDIETSKKMCKFIDTL